MPNGILRKAAHTEESQNKKEVYFFHRLKKDEDIKVMKTLALYLS